MAKIIKIKNSQRGENTEQYLVRLEENFNEKQIKVLAERALKKFKKNTPSDSGKTADSWEYEIEKRGNGWVINFNNTNIQNGMNIALLVENGHATPSGKWVPGKHFIEKTLNEIKKDILIEITTYGFNKAFNKILDI